MNFDLLLLRFGELNLKGKNRSRFEKTVIQHFRRLTAPYKNLKLTTEYGRVYVHLNGEPYEQVTESLTRIFGLDSYSPVLSAPLELEAIREAGLRLMQQFVKQPRTFKVSVKRVNKSFPHDTMEMNTLVGGYILRAMPGLEVDVRNPEAELRIELREDRALLFTEVIAGAGGFPLGTNGKAVLMLSGGIDSPVAGWLAMRKGLEIEAVHFHSYPYTSERAKQKVMDLAAKLSVYSGQIKLHLVPFTRLQTKLREEYNENLMITLMRRMMFRITEKLAEKHGATAIVTGESLGQVASQTLPSLRAIGHVVQLPILQPLIATDKQDIIRLAQSIDTYELSILPYEDCCTIFLPPSPSTNPNLQVLQSIEAGFTWLDELLADTVDKVETVIITPESKQEVFSELF